MSTGAEQELKERLGHAVGAITPRPAPIDRAMAQGRVIRTRRRVTALACLAAAAVVAVAVPVALQARLPAAGRSHDTHHTVTVHQGGHPEGLVAYGTVDGRHWQVRLLKPGTGGVRPGEQCWVVLGASDCSDPLRVSGSEPAALTMTGQSGTEAVYGPVAADVTALRLTLTDGTVLTLHPVAAYGTRNVAFAAPAAAILKITAYGRAGEIATAIPLHTPRGGLNFYTWLHPGQPGLPRLTRLIGVGRIAGSAWSVTARMGPWGHCLVLDTPGGADSTCFAFTGRPDTSLIGYTGGPPIVAYGQTSARTAHMVITLSNHTQIRVPAVSAGARKYFAFAVAHGVRALRWTAYDSARQETASGRLTGGL
jgi:hypothetical protein